MYTICERSSPDHPRQQPHRRHHIRIALRTAMAFIASSPALSSAFAGASVGAAQRSSLRPPVPRAANPMRFPRMSAVPRNANFGKLQAGYLFPEIGRRRSAYLAEHPGADIISLGVGDTTMPVPPHICDGLQSRAASLGAAETYVGYGPEQGYGELRDKISASMYGGRIAPDEIFVSDGAKCDISRLQQVFGPGATIAVQDPSYPVYVDTAVMMGQTGEFAQDDGHFGGIEYMRCDAANGFFPDLSTVKRTDLIFFCSPNNPTGAAATTAQLKQLIDFATANGSIIVYDAAYAPFINDPAVPKSIFEVEGAEACAIEVNSFSKYAGFTGVRLGWVAIPKGLTFADGSPVRDDFNRVMTTCFNGASVVSQAGGLACLDSEGKAEIQTLIEYYLGNARLLRSTMIDLGFEVYGGTDAPYIWVRFPGRSSWDVFNDILEKVQIVTIPGAGFGPGGEGYLRLSAFAPRQSCEEACKRLRSIYSNVAV